MLFLLLGLLSFAAAEEDWHSICTTTNDIAKFCAEYENDRAGAYSCLAEEYNKELSQLTRDCREKMQERAQKARQQAQEEAEKNDWAYICSSDLEKVCGMEDRGEQWQCLASAYKSDKSELSAECIASIEARSSRAHTNWVVLCQSEIEATCTEVEDEAQIFPCLAAKVKEDATSITEQCADSLEDLWEQVCIPDLSEKCPEAKDDAEQIQCLMKDPNALTNSCTSTLRVLFHLLSAKNGDVQPGPVAADPVGIPSTETSTPAPKRPVGPPAGFNPAGPQAPTAVKPKQCPMLAEFPVRKCPKKVRLGWGLNDKGFCKPLRGCRFQRKWARKQKFFHTRKGCAKIRKSCNN